MRRFVVALVATAALSFAAQAADMPVKAPVYKAPAPAYSWTGFYVGLNAGAAINHSSYTVEPIGCYLTGACGGGAANNPLRTDSADLNNAAFTGGGQVGYNYQFNSMGVVGVEADFNYNGVNQSDAVSRALVAPLVGTFSHTVSQKFDFFGTVRGRLGVLAMPNLMLFATGGLAWGHIKSDSTVAFSAAPADNYSGSGSQTRAGWTAGGGLEYALDRYWSVKAEYLYIDLGTFSYAVPCAGPAAFCAAAPTASYQTDLKTREHVARVGFNYKFAP